MRFSMNNAEIYGCDYFQKYQSTESPWSWQSTARDAGDGLGAV